MKALTKLEVQECVCVCTEIISKKSNVTSLRRRLEMVNVPEHLLWVLVQSGTSFPEGGDTDEHTADER